MDTNITTELYFESHITIEPVFDSDRVRVAEIMRPFKFKLADLLMKKRSEDTEVRSKNDTFTTGHSKDFEDLRNRTVLAVKELQKSGYKVWRYKIENTIIDSKFEDVEGLLVDIS